MNETCMNDYDTDTYEVVQPPGQWKSLQEKTPEQFKQAKEEGDKEGDRNCCKCVGMAAIVLLLVSLLVLVLLICIGWAAFLQVQVRQLEKEVGLLRGDVTDVNVSSSAQSGTVETLLSDLIDLTADNVTAETTRKIEETSFAFRTELDLMAEEVVENFTSLQKWLSSVEEMAREVRNTTVEMLSMIQVLNARLGGALEATRLLEGHQNLTASGVAALQAKVTEMEASVNAMNRSLFSDISQLQETFDARLRDISYSHSTQLDSVTQNLSSILAVLDRHDNRHSVLASDVNQAMHRISTNENSTVVLAQGIAEVQEESNSWYNNLVNVTSNLRDFSRQIDADLTVRIMNVLSNSTGEDLKTSQVIDGIRRNVSHLDILSELYTSHVFASCEEVELLFPNYPPGFYRVVSYHNGTAFSDITYCNLSLTTCGNITGNWRRIGYFNGTESYPVCPGNLTYHYNWYPSLYGCVSVTYGCSIIQYDPYNLPYSKVCGKVTGFQVRDNPTGFTSTSYGDRYSANLDGVRITYGPSSRHLWSYANGYCGNCTNRKPALVSNHFSCDGPDGGGYSSASQLWEEGGGCQSGGGASSWFVRELAQPSADFIYLSICAPHYPTFAVDGIELYVSN